MKTSTTSAFATTLLLSAAGAQQQQYTVNPDTVSDSTREFWCQQQTTQCPLICLDQGSSSGATRSNECNSDALTYSCVCDNGISPNISEYSNTLPYSLCTEWGTQCVANCGPDTECASDCRTQHPCGAQNPTRQNTSTLTSSRPTATSLATGSAAEGSSNAQVTTDADGSTVTVFNGFSGQSSSDQSGGVKNVRVWALGVGQTFGTLGLLGAAALGFAILL